MSVPLLTKAFQASAAVAGWRFVNFSDVAASSRVAQAAANTGPIIGVSDGMGASINEMVDVHMMGIVMIELGGTVTAGQTLSADANGRAVAVVGAATTTRRVGAIALEPGVNLDRIQVLIVPSVIQLP
jgi:hypothetical protein